MFRLYITVDYNLIMKKRFKFHKYWSLYNRHCLLTVTSRHWVVKKQGFFSQRKKQIKATGHHIEFFNFKLWSVAIIFFFLQLIRKIPLARLTSWDKRRNCWWRTSVADFVIFVTLWAIMEHFVFHRFQEILPTKTVLRTLSRAYKQTHK